MLRQGDTWMSECYAHAKGSKYRKCAEAHVIATVQPQIKAEREMQNKKGKNKKGFG